MDFDEFKSLFLRAIESAIVDAEARTKQTFSRKIEIELHGAGYSNVVMEVNMAADALFIDSETSYVVIDVAIKKATHDNTLVFVRASGHPPVPYSKAWGAKQGTGPFKQIIALGQVVLHSKSTEEN